MKKVNIKLTASIFLILLLFSFVIKDDGGEKNKVIMDIMMRSLKEIHFKKHNVNNDLSEKIFGKYIDMLDYNKRFFLRSDVDEFEKFKYKIDDEIKAGKFAFFNISKEIYKKRMKEVEKYYTKPLKSPFDFTIDENLEFDPEKRKFMKTKDDLKEFWRKYLKQQVMVKLAGDLKIQEDAKERNDTTVKIETYEELESKARKEVKKTYDDWFYRMMKVNDKDLISIYFNSIAAIYGPHTQYFPPKDKANFDIRMSGKLEGIGATLSQPNAYIKVARIVPGSACWKQGELEAGDLILKVAQGDKDPVNVVDMRLDDAIQMIRGKKGTEVRLTVKKADGSIKVIPIIRDVVVIEETYAKSSVIEDKSTGKKIAYVYLPGFYADFNNPLGRRCSKDIEKEVIKAKQTNVDGIVIDLRNNGGGSLQDVVDIVGLFIEKGPIVQVKGRYGMPRSLADRNSKVLYDGPLAVMINQNSASASEIMAAALQDYGRGVIVGSKQSFGKGTVQRFIPFDRMVNGHNELKPLGELKITTQKFYRINGGSTQLKGVYSDIVLPNIYSELETGEKDLEYPVKWDEITRSEYTKCNLNLDISALKGKSNIRLSNNTTFLMINEYAHYMKESQDKTISTLNLKKYRKIEKERNERNKKYRDALKHISDLEFSAFKTDSLTIYSDSLKSAQYSSWLKELKKDIYIDEVYKIASDMSNTEAQVNKINHK